MRNGLIIEREEWRPATTPVYRVLVLTELSYIFMYSRITKIVCMYEYSLILCCSTLESICNTSEYYFQ